MTIEKNIIDPSDIEATALDRSFHLTLEAKISHGNGEEQLIFIPEHNTEYTKYMRANCPSLEEGEIVLGFETEVVAIWPSPIDAPVRLGTFGHSVFHDSFHFYIMTFSRGYNLEEVIKEQMQESGWKKHLGIKKKYRTIVEIVPISEIDSHGV
jgi:hypothetical protein